MEIQIRIKSENELILLCFNVGLFIKYYHSWKQKQDKNMQKKLSYKIEKQHMSKLPI